MKMNLGSKIGGGFGGVLFIAMLLGGLAIWSMKSVSTQTDMLANEYVPQVGVANSLQNNYTKFVQDMIYYSLLADDARYNSAVKNYEEVIKEVDKGKELAANSEHLVKLKDAIGKIESNVIEYKSLCDQTAAINRSSAENFNLMVDAIARYNTACNELLTYQNQALSREISSGASQQRLKERSTKLALLNDITNLVDGARINLYKARATRNPEGLKDAVESFSQINSKLDNILQTTSRQANRDQVETIRETTNIYKNALTVYMDDQQKLAALGAKRAPMAFAIQDVAITTANNGLNETLNIANGAASSLSSASTTMVVGLIIALLIGIGLAIFITRMIVKPVTFLTEGAGRLALGDVALSGMDQSEIVAINSRGDELGDIGKAFSELIDSQKTKANAAEQIANGNLGIKVEVAGSEDVLGNAMVEMAGSLQKVNSELQGLTGAALEGQLDTRADTSAHNGDYGKLVGGINELFGAIVAPIQEGAGILQAAANKDLTKRVKGIYKGQLADFVDNINTTVDALDGAMQQVGEAVEQVSSASGQISSGSQSLAQGANEQASSLEEISSSLEEMSSMTKQNADNANQAKTLSGSARDSADKGSQSMERMTDAINRIKTSSDETAKIVKTIDEIAFQTNLLALNAAVEAARAGEAGKGFAVVAEEVRNLAQRSAEAAKNTTEMIDEAVKNAEDGVSITDEVASVLTEIVDGSGKVNDLVAEISAAAGEQAQGIEQVNTAVSQMDQVTQQNASNSEESASAAEELNSQAEELQRMVREFSLSKRTGAVNKPAVTNRLQSSTIATEPAVDTKPAKIVSNRIQKLAPQATGTNGNGNGNGNGKKESRPAEEMIPLDDDDFGDF